MRAIDADALSDWLKDYGQKCIKGERKISLMYVWKHIQDMQTIEERKTGKWELIDDTKFRIPGYRCSVCHCECEDWENKPTYNYCPFCGADMRGEQDGRNDINT